MNLALAHDGGFIFNRDPGRTQNPPNAIQSLWQSLPYLPVGHKSVMHMRRHTLQPSMSDTRQAKRSSKPASSVVDISHVGSKSQENKPLENMVHQTFLPREVKQQVSRYSSQENVRQETKRTVALPVLCPKQSSIQPTSDPVLPPDQFFKPQEATCAPFHPAQVKYF